MEQVEPFFEQMLISRKVLLFEYFLNCILKYIYFFATQTKFRSCMLKTTKLRAIEIKVSNGSIHPLV